MFSQTYPLCPQSLYYFQLAHNSGIQYANYFSGLPFTYQNQFLVPTYQYEKFSFDRLDQSPPSSMNDILVKTDDSENTMQKSLQKKSEKKFSIFKYPKKNAESNVINQIFSFLSLRIKSQPYLEKILENNAEKIENFYELLKQLKKKNKKYINRCYIKDLAFFNEEHFGYKIMTEINSKGSKNTLTMQEFQKSMRILVAYYLRSKCISTVVTSRKLDKQTMREHLHRKRQVQEYFLTQMQIVRDSKE